MDALFPPNCPVCGEIIVPRGGDCCAACEDRLSLVKAPKCFRCGRALQYWEEEYCADCMRTKHSFDRCFALWEYDKLMQGSISRFKFQGRTEYTDFYASRIVKFYGACLKALSPDVVIPVPIHRSRYQERGFNQAELLARELGARLFLPVCSDLLQRKKKTVPQKGLTAKERKENLQHAFCFSDKAAAAFKQPVQTVLLVDDIYTTGSTLDACSYVLKAKGVRYVYGICICIGKG